MAFVVRRPGGRWEVRESFTSEAGPRARTLASFKVLSPQVIERAVAAARRPVDRDSIVRAANKAGAPVELSAGDTLAGSLLRSLARGATVRPGVRRLLIEQLTDPKHADDSFAEWIGASLEERAAALVDLLDLADRLPKPPQAPPVPPALAGRVEPVTAAIGLANKVERLHRSLSRARIQHAFGEAIALAYYTTPRATVDVDMNVFVTPDRYEHIAKILRRAGVDRFPEQADALRDPQVRAWWGSNPVDLFFSYDPIHDAMRDAVRTVPFGRTTIPILAPEHLLVAKAVFDRSKDWVDIEQMLVAMADLDRGEVERWLTHLVGNDDPRAERVRMLWDESRGAD